MTASEGTPIRLALCTAPAEVAADLARKLVEERLVACVNRLPAVQSVYRWEGAVEEAEETLLVLKTTADRVDALRQRLQELHPYDVPELLVFAVDSGLPAYLSWVAAECDGGD